MSVREGSCLSRSRANYITKSARMAKLQEKMYSKSAVKIQPCYKTASCLRSVRPVIRISHRGSMSQEAVKGCRVKGKQKQLNEPGLKSRKKSLSKPAGNTKC